MDPFSTNRRNGPKRGIWVILALLVFVSGAWVALVVAAGAGGEAGEHGRAARAGDKSQAEATVGGTGPRHSVEPGLGSSHGEEGRPPPPTGDDNRGEPTPHADRHGADREDVFVRAPEGRGAKPPKGGVRGEPGGYDPLGKDAPSGALTETQKGRVELAATNFVTYAYGYTGDDLSEYQRNLNRVALFPDFYSSPGAEAVRDFQEDIQKGGVKSAAVLESFEIEDQTPATVRGVAYFVVGERYLKAGAVAGEVNRYAQPLNLQSFGPHWKVVATGEREEVN